MVESRSLLELLSVTWRRRHQDWLRFAVRLTGDINDAEDAVQDGILRTLSANNTELADERSVHRFVCTAIRTAIIDRSRRRRSRSRLLRELAKDTQGHASAALESVVADEIELDAKQRLKAIEKALATLEPENKEAIQLYYLTEPGMRFRGIAEAQEVSVSTAHERVKRALKQLREGLVEQEDDDG